MTHNPLSKILTTLVSQYRSRYNKTELANKIGLSRRGLYDAIRSDKDFGTFKASTLISITAIFPVTIQISEGKVRCFRWDRIPEN